MALEIEGKLIKILPARTGEGRNGQWKSQEFIIETPGQYPTQVCIGIWNDRINIGEIAIGETIKVQFDVRSREYQDKWFTSLTAYRIDKIGVMPVGGGQPVSQPQSAGTSNVAPPSGPAEMQSGAGNDDLPF